VKVAILLRRYGRRGTAIPGFRDGLRDLGYVEGNNITFEARAARCGDIGLEQW